MSVPTLTAYYDDDVLLSVATWYSEAVNSKRQETSLEASFLFYRTEKFSDTLGILLQGKLTNGRC